ncbi:unnamed protein product [Echinostoma caproni]|uniref:POT1PC domain-containing protein n=1 Tax=Echinostoma caproni TaxID=27848 RepID=A0A183AUS3_9TREM|nr:unnamed protein product [Echinostoma caproni]
MHRLVINEFRGHVQGCGYASTGFTAAVFSGQINDPLTPRHCPVACSLDEPELDRVKELRNWYHSPACPVERERANPLEPSCSTLLGLDASRPVGNGSLFTVSQPVSVKRLWGLSAEKFVSVQGQVVSIYRHTNGNHCVVLYLWDGPPPTYTSRADTTGTLAPGRSRYFGVSRDYLTFLSATSEHQPELVAITAHGFTEEEAADCSLSLWSVPVVVYDEHATNSTMTDLRPGDLVQINNVHVDFCRQPECLVSGCLRLIVHGGGYQFSRGIQFLGSSRMLEEYMHLLETGEAVSDSLQALNQFNLLTNLRDGILRRPPALKMPGSPAVPVRRFYP